MCIRDSIQIQGMEYKEMTKQLLNKCALATLIPSKVSLIGIKPNLVAPVPAEFGGTTHPEVALISTHFTATLGIPLASPALQPSSFQSSSRVEPGDFTSDLLCRLRSL